MSYQNTTRNEPNRDTPEITQQRINPNGTYATMPCHNEPIHDSHNRSMHCESPRIIPMRGTHKESYVTDASLSIDCYERFYFFHPHAINARSVCANASPLFTIAVVKRSTM